MNGSAAGRPGSSSPVGNSILIINATGRRSRMFEAPHRSKQETTSVVTCLPHHIEPIATEATAPAQHGCKTPRCALILDRGGPATSWSDYTLRGGKKTKQRPANVANWASTFTHFATSLSKPK